MIDALAEFEPRETLRYDTLSRSTVLLGSIRDSPAIVCISRTQLPDFSGGLDLQSTKLLEKNDIYSWYLATLYCDVEKSPDIKIDVICPATDIHIAKYREYPKRLVNETPEIYNNVVRPYIETMKGDRLNWIRAIFYEGAEAARILFIDDNPETGYVIAPNSKWDCKNLDSLYLLAIVKRDDLASIRDLTAEHIPFLLSIKKKAEEICREKYNMAADEIKIYFHYQPSYYHLHLHIVNINYEQSDFGRSILFDNVVDMLCARPKGLRDVTLSYILSTGHEIWRLINNYLRD